jgi:glycerol dehydrogenase
MLHTAIFPGRYIQGAGALDSFVALVAPLGRNLLVLAGGTALRELVPALRTACAGAGLDLLVEPFCGECTDEEIARLSALASAHRRDVVVALGGGKALDTGKAVAHAVGVRSVIVPTIASTDAPCSALSVVYVPDGAFKRYLFLPRNPDLVLVDTALIARAPVRFLVAGIGDALSTWFEADACRQAYAPNQAGGHGTLAARALARLCYDTILEFGPAALRSCEAGVATPALEHVVEANTLLSGLGFESAGLASAHSIHNGLTRLHGTHAFYHGEKVAIGVQAGLFLADRPRAVIDQVYAFCEEVGLPVTLAQIGLPAPTDAELREVAAAACAEGETIHHEPSPVTPARVFAALRAADAHGRRLRSVRHA